MRVRPSAAIESAPVSSGVVRMALTAPAADDGDRHRRGGHVVGDVDDRHDVGVPEREVEALEVAARVLHQSRDRLGCGPPGCSTIAAQAAAV